MFKLTMIEDTKIKENYDVIIIGTGPAGYSAAIYARRFNRDTLIIGNEFGGMASEAVEIENYPGFKKIPGNQLMDRFKEHAQSLGAEIIQSEVVNLEKNNNFFTITTDKNKKINARAVIIATGSSKRHLNITDEDKYFGKGISYCATCDAAFYKDKIVGIVGGGDSAMNDALLLSEFAKKVYIIHRRDKLRAAPQWIKKVKQKQNIEFIMNSQVIGITGENKVQKIILKTKEENESNKTLDVDGLFIAIGVIPSTTLAKQVGINIDDKSRIIVDNEMRTNQNGIFAAGDCTNACPTMLQIITASAQGATAAESANRYLHNNF